MVDEEIAKMLRKERTEARRKEEREQELREEEALDMEDVLRQVRSGTLELYEREFVFEEKSLLKDRVHICLPTEGIEVKRNLDEAYEDMSNVLSYSSHVVLELDAKEFMAMDVYKKNMEKNLEGTGLSFKWIEEGAMMCNG